MDSIGERLKEIRQLRGVTQLAISDKAKINAALYRQYECGDRTPKAEQLQKIASALDVDIAFLQPSRTDTPFAILALLYELSQTYGKLEVENAGNNTLFGVDGEKYPAENIMLEEAKKAHDALSEREFTKWLVESSPYSADSEMANDMSPHSEDDVTKQNSHTDLERIIFLKRLANDMQLIINDQLELIENNILSKNTTLAQHHIGVLRRTINSIVENELGKY